MPAHGLMMQLEVQSGSAQSVFPSPSLSILSAQLVSEVTGATQLAAEAQSGSAQSIFVSTSLSVPSLQLVSMHAGVQDWQAPNAEHVLVHDVPVEPEAQDWVPHEAPAVG